MKSEKGKANRMDTTLQEYRDMLAAQPAKTEKKLWKLAKKGDLQAVEALHGCYEKYITEAKTAKEAAKIFKQVFKVCFAGAKHNSPYWLIMTGEMYRYGIGTDKNGQKAFDCYKKAAALGSVDAVVKVGRAYMNGIGVPVDYEESLRLFEAAAGQDNPEAMVLLAYQYENGKGAATDYGKALEWLDRAERSCNGWLERELTEKDRRDYQSLLEDVEKKRRHCEAVSCVGLLEDENIAEEQKQQALSRLLELAGKENDSRAQVHLGILYEEGKAVEQDEKKALDYYLMAAGNGSTGAMNNIGNFYLHGKAVEKDLGKAFAWYKKAVELSGNAAAGCSLGMCFQYGYGTAVDYEKARYYYGESAKQGFGLALYRLGCLYEQGLGVTKDIRMAKQYFGEALHRGYRDAALKL